MKKGITTNLVWPDLDFIYSIAQDHIALKAMFNSHSSIIESGRSLLCKNFETILKQRDTEALNIFVPIIHDNKQEKIKEDLEKIYNKHTNIKISWFSWKGISNMNLKNIHSRIETFDIPHENADRNITSQYYLTKAFLGDKETAEFNVEDLKNAIQVCISDETAEKLRIEKPKVKIPPFFKNNKPAIEGVSAPIKEMKKRIHRVSTTSLNVMLSGETGSGKEAAAFFIHDLSGQREKAFIAMNCANFNKEFLISELFGHKKGAFTGATIDKKGIIADLKEGTLFLDELPEMPKPCQSMLLRFLEDGMIRPLGSNKEEGPYKNIRIIGAGQPDRIKKKLRPDLLFRIGEKKINIPPLRDIVNEDLSGLIDHILYKNSKDPKQRSVVKGFFKNEKYYSSFKEYPWPGNVRELATFVKRRLQMGKSEEKDILEDIKSSGGETKENIEPSTHNHQDFDSEFKSLIQKYAARIPESSAKRKYPEILPTFKNLQSSYIYYVSEGLRNKKNQNQITHILDIVPATRKKQIDNFQNYKKEKKR